VTSFSEGRASVLTKRDQDGQQQPKLKKTSQKFVKIIGRLSGAKQGK
jgi:hypothetical protein